MMMLDCSKALRPGLPRIGHIGNNIVLPRTVDLASALGAIIGGISGLLFGLLIGRRIIGGATGVFMCCLAGVAAGLGLVQWRPWQGEHAGRVAMVRGKAAIKTRKTVCPGTSLLPIFNDTSGRWQCGRCMLHVDPVDGLAPKHDWKRRLYVGVQEVQTPVTGPIRFTSGSTPVVTGVDGVLRYRPRVVEDAPVFATHQGDTTHHIGVLRTLPGFDDPEEGEQAE